MRESKRTSFDRSLYASSEETTLFYSTVCKMFEHQQLCKPTPFHRFLDELAIDRRLLRHFTQNIDCIDQKLRHLNARTIRLHGQVDQMRCHVCGGVSIFEPRLFSGSLSPDCQKCVERNQARGLNGKRLWRTGKLKPDVVLYGDPNPNDESIFEAIDNDLEICPDLIVVVGTTLKVPGTLQILKDFCRATRSKGGATIWISKKEPPSKSRGLFDYILQGDCDAVDT
jgi:NAD-dependent histone deacetylase SIR2